jgi:hypothetical protein
MIAIVTPVIVRKRNCPRCGQKVGAGDAVCPHCGMTLPTPARSNVLVVLGLLLTLVLGVMVALQYL